MRLGHERVRCLSCRLYEDVYYCSYVPYHARTEILYILLYALPVRETRWCGNAIHPALCERPLFSHRCGARSYPGRYRRWRTDGAPKLRQILRARTTAPSSTVSASTVAGGGQIAAPFQLSNGRHRTAYWTKLALQINAARCARSRSALPLHLPLMSFLHHANESRGSRVTPFLALTVSPHSSSQSSYRAQSA
jgi:hypothetical protein